MNVKCPKDGEARVNAEIVSAAPGSAAGGNQERIHAASLRWYSTLVAYVIIMYLMPF